MTEKRYSHDDIVIVDHLKEDLIYIDGKDELLELAEYVDKLQEENGQLKGTVDDLSNDFMNLMKKNEELKKLLEYSREETNDYYEELMGKDEFIRLYKRQRDGVVEWKMRS